MTCPVCGGKTKVIDSRCYDSESVWRRRECLECNHRFTTIELETETLREQRKRERMNELGY